MATQEKTSSPIAIAADANELQRRSRELSILKATAEALNREVDLNRALHVALAQVVDLFDLRTGWIWLLHPETGEPYLAAAQNLPPALADAPRRMEGDCYCLDTFRAGDLEGAANVSIITCTRLKGLLDGTDGLRSHASVPLYAHGKRLGVLNVVSGDWRELSAENLRLLYTVGDLIGIAIERARLFTTSTQLGALEERNRLAREIHDTLVQGLTGIIMQLETADALLESEQVDRGREALVRALALTRANLEEARRSVLDLRAAPLEGRSLAKALAAMVDEWKATSHLKIKFESTGQRPLPARLEVALYRIAQEALTNVARHAQARRTAVRLTTTPAFVQLTIEDDGRGFDPAQVPADHHGLIGMQERARLLGGTLELHSQPDRGTRLQVTVPL
ncbi:MAG TPA: GAF domain-containing sensor histidine kinase [Anaerolineae bacterium]|nr:GAF domain-containing sensor histidine kinase [Anaerolineae bacterium]